MNRIFYLPYGETPERDLWQMLSECRRPILVYGMGNGADKLTERLLKRGLSVADHFASDGFVRGQSFRGKRVLSREEAFSRHPNAIVLLAFASRRQEVLEMLYLLDGEAEMYMPDLPVSGEADFDLSFYLAHREELREAADMLSDDESRRILDRVLRYKLSGKLSYLRETGAGKASLSDILPYHEFETVIDGGAYAGDTASELLSLAPSVREIYAVEPDPGTYRRLLRYAEGEARARVIPIAAALSEKEEILTFSSSGNRNSTLGSGSYEAKREKVRGITVDSLALSPDFIKLDVEGAERQALLGARETILRARPSLLVSLYHRSEDLFALPLLLRELCPNYRFYLRRDECLPAWELNLLAVPEKGETPCPNCSPRQGILKN